MNAVTESVLDPQTNGRAVPAGNGWTWVTDGVGLFGKSALMWIVFMVLFILVAVVAGLIPLVGQLALNIALPLFVAGAMLGCRAIERGEALEIDHIVTGFSERPMPLVIIGILYMVASLVVVLVMVLIAAVLIGGTVGLAVLSQPGNLGEEAIIMAVLMGTIGLLVGMAIFVPVAMAFWFAVPLVKLQGLDPMDALSKSFAACWQNVMPFLVYGLAMLGLLIIAIIPLGLGLLVWVPLMYITTYTSYQDVFVTQS